MIPFTEFPKIPRLSREVVITEKIDGTNASIYIPELPDELDGEPLMPASRTRWLRPMESDNFGFGRWVREHKDELLQLGPGHHYGEWWGSGIQRGYGLINGEKRFSLFNVHRWATDRPSCCGLVPVLASGIFTTDLIEQALVMLRTHGSYAAEGFMKPEGIVIYHEASRTMFKKTLEKDESPKGA